MIYNLKNKIQADKAKQYLNTLIESDAIIELKQKRKNRTYQQNRYLHLILSYFALDTGHSLEYIKQEVFKRLVNRDLFLKKVNGKLGTVNELRSSSELDTKEMTEAIERFRSWCSTEFGIYIPGPNENEYLQSLEQELNNMRIWQK